MALPSLVLPCRCMVRSEKFVSLATLIADLGNFLVRRWWMSLERCVQKSPTSEQLQRIRKDSPRAMDL